MTYNVNITGTLTNNNGVLSEFSSSNYATVNTPFNPSSNDWVIQLGLTTSNSLSGDQFFLGQLGSSTASVIMGIQNAEFFIALRDEIGDNIVEFDKISYIGVDANTKYYIRISYSGSAGYEIKTSPDETSWTTIWSSGYTTTVGMPSNLMLGVNGDASSPFQGSIDLNDCYIEVDNTIVWRGVSQAYNGVHIQLRRDTLSNWTTVNPTLYNGEVGLITDQAKYVVGDGTSTFTSLTKHNMDTDISNLANTSLSNLTSSGKQLLSSASMPVPSATLSDDDIALPASSSSITASADGWLFMVLANASVGDYIQFNSTITGAGIEPNGLIAGSTATMAGQYLYIYMPVKEGQTVYLYYQMTGSAYVLMFRFIKTYMEGV